MGNSFSQNNYKVALAFTKEENDRMKANDKKWSFVSIPKTIHNYNL
jgi:hypothetical protein